ncbi:MAG: hypothetical protein J0L86_16790 [Flavobacteriales bacterium]|nr:hypothetical protein [Flavobacteriales bacterium]
MGTRNLTMVIQDQQTKVAQYGQWDGYPEGQGLTILSFLEEKTNIEKLKQILPKVRFENKQDMKQKSEFFKSMGAEDGWMNMEQADQFHKRYPLLTRNLGGEILSKMLEYANQKEIVLVNSEDFALDSLFCEWAYVVDLDKNTLEVYKGFNQSAITPKDRFYNLYDKKNRYKPIKIVKSFSLDKLPDAEKFISECNKQHQRDKTLSKSQDNDLER